MDSRYATWEELAHLGIQVNSETGRISEGSTCADCDVIASRVYGDNVGGHYDRQFETLEILIRDPVSGEAWVMRHVDQRERQDIEHEGCYDAAGNEIGGWRD